MKDTVEDRGVEDTVDTVEDTEEGTVEVEDNQKGTTLESLGITP